MNLLKVTVIGFDINKEKIEGYKNGIDVTGEVEKLRTQAFSSQVMRRLKTVQIFIVSVPTP